MCPHMGELDTFNVLGKVGYVRTWGELDTFNVLGKVGYVRTWGELDTFNVLGKVGYVRTWGQLDTFPVNLETNSTFYGYVFGVSRTLTHTTHLEYKNY